MDTTGNVDDIERTSERGGDGEESCNTVVAGGEVDRFLFTLKEYFDKC